MSELNHELDRDNLNKEGSKALGGLSFPSESEKYERNPPSKMGWDFADAVKGAHNERRSLGMSFEKIS